ncbi:MAG: excinuclease ABC subunit UvrC, partial [archaeon]
MIYLNIIPNNPGCYIFKDTNDQVIYVGKAKNLKKRVSSYFANIFHDTKTTKLISLISNIDYIITDSEIEALILENSLIKKYMPKYNIDLKLSEKYAYITITNEQFPRLITSRTKPKNADYFGPFTDGGYRVKIIKYLSRIFKLRQCKKLPKRECTLYHIGLCDAPCAGKITLEEYNNKIKYVKMILNGKVEELIKELQIEMKAFSEKLNFEKAKILRDRINALAYLTDKQKIEREKSFNEDIINYIVKDNIAYFIIFNINKGVLKNKIDFNFKIEDNDSKSSPIIDEFLLKYYRDKQIPKELILPQKPNNKTINYLEEQTNDKIIITVPKKGEKRKLLTMCLKNIEINQISNFSILKALQEK